MTEYQLTWILVIILIPFILLILYRIRENKIFKQRLLAAELTLKEHEHSSARKKKKRAGIGVKLYYQNSDHYLLEFFNTGEVALRNIEMELLLEENQANPLVLAEFEKKFPIRRLAVRKSVTLTTVQYATSPSVYNIRLRWTEPDGTRVADQIYVAVEASNQ